MLGRLNTRKWISLVILFLAFQVVRGLFFPNCSSPKIRVKGRTGIRCASAKALKFQIRRAVNMVSFPIDDL